jgi:TldD protein
MKSIMIEQLQKTLENLKEYNIDYADIRVTLTTNENLKTENINIKNISMNCMQEFGVRVIYKGCEGFSGGYNIEEIENVAQTALSIAKHAAKYKNEIFSKDIFPSNIKDTYITKIKKDPFEICLQDKLTLLFDCGKACLNVKNIYRVEGLMNFSKEEKIFLNTENSIIEQTIYKTGVEINIRAKNDKEVQTRSYPNSYGGCIVTAGYEYIEGLDLIAKCVECSKEASMLLNAPVCPKGCFDLIIHPDQLAIQIHESIGHAVELDRILGYEESLAGGSFVSTKNINNGFKYGSDYVNVFADPTLENGTGSYGYDDDGIKSQKTTLIENGILKNVLSSVLTAKKIGMISNGHNIAEGANNLPIVRMSNINLEPGEYTLTNLIKKVDYGFLLKTNKSWSIDDKRLNFQFGCEIAYEIANGTLTGKIYKNPVYFGHSIDFWSSCDGICNQDFFELHCAAICGKGLPYQEVSVGHGSSPTLFRKVKVGV